MKIKFIAALFVFVFLSGCIIDAEVKRDELNIWAHSSQISRETKMFRLVEIINDSNEDPHYRGTAVKLAAELKITEAINPMFKILGENVTQPENSEYLKIETVSAIGSYGRADLYRRVMLLMYTLSKWENSSIIRRFFVQSFNAVPDFTNEESITNNQALTVEVLIEMLKTANTKKEDQSIVYMINNKLQLLTGHTELTHKNIDAWNEVKIKMLKDVRNN